MRIIPAIDIIDGKCVRLSQGDFNKKTIYNDDPLEMALLFENYGIKFLHLVDLDGALEGFVKNMKVLERISTKTKLSIDFGGGINSVETANSVFDSGAQQITIGSLAIKKPEIFRMLLLKFGPDKIILGADVLNKQIKISGWKIDTEKSIFELINDFKADGLRNVMCTDIHRDGMMQGPSIDLYREIISFTDLNLIASGGISELNDLQELNKIGCEGAIVGKAIYEGKISLKEISALC